MSDRAQPVSLVAERAVRRLREVDTPLASIELAAELLAARVPDEATAHRLLSTAFAGDPRLTYREGRWHLGQPETRHPAPRRGARPLADPDRVLLFVEGGRPARSEPFRMTAVSALRLRDDEVIAACGGDPLAGAQGRRLRRAVLQTLEGAVPVIHDAPGAVRALEVWLDQPLPGPISLRKLGQRRLGLSRTHDLEEMAGRLGLAWRETDDPLEQADTLDACLQRLRRAGESLQDLRAHGAGSPTPLDWSRFAFDREFLRRVPRAPGTYRFHDTEGRLLYVGKSKNLHRRIGSYFRETGGPRSPRVQRLIDRLRSIDYEATGSELEAMLREAEQIRRDAPESNVQRRVHPAEGRAARLRSILILEGADPPAVLRAYLIRDGRLVARHTIGPRGGGLKAVERALDDWFFAMPSGPRSVQGPDLDVEVVMRWLTANRDRVVAFDPTDLAGPADVVDRLRWFLEQGTPFDADGSPIRPY